VAGATNIRLRWSREERQGMCILQPPKGGPPWIVVVSQVVLGQPAFLRMTPGGGVNMNSESGAM
jgi:hypothetical protein